MHLLVIDIGFDPNLFTIGGVRIAWHGIFTAFGIAAAVYVAAYFARIRRVDEDAVYSVALWSIPAGLVGARLLYVFEHASSFADNWARVFALNEGGISVYGAIIGGALVGFGYAWRRHLPMRGIADIAALGLTIGLAVGRIGDLINGEHWAKASSLPWAFCYTNPNTLNGDPVTNTVAACGSINGNPLAPAAVHPVAGLYEPLLLLGIFAALWYLFRRLSTPGYLFWIFIILYAAMRLVLAPLRLNESMVGPMSVPQLLSLATVIFALSMLVFTRRVAPRPVASG